MSEAREEIARIRAARKRAAAASKKETMARGPEKVADVLERLLKRRGLDRQMEYQKVIDDWPRLVGEGVAGVTRARSVANGVLIVEVVSSAWAMELNMRKRQIMARLNAGRSIRIERVVFVLSGDGWG